MDTYRDFKVLLDDPAEIPGLGFDAYASALAEVILRSKAEFAVGIFGSWGSGKTTLMRAIERALARHDSVVAVWFTAWRYERDPHLIVPLLDVLREALDKRAGENSSWAREAASGVARAARAFLAGLRLSVGLPGFGIEVDAGEVIEAIEAENDAGTKQLSFYQAGFMMLRDAISQLSDNGRRRVVIFVDDLDRCLPSNALQVLESMKLFFDVEGCVFVVGLDQEIAELAVATKYSIVDSKGTLGVVSGNDYVKKIFQVPFALPRISSRQLQDYLSTIEANADLEDGQREDFHRNIRRHLRFLPSEDSVNPREIKRLINAYILQLKMLSSRLGARLHPDVVLALQVMSFRPDWRELYEHLAADPELFQSVLRETMQEPEPSATVWLSGVKIALPAGFVQYLRRDAEAVLEVDDLAPYVSAAESTRHTDPSVREARAMVNRLRRTTDEFASGRTPASAAASKLSSDVKRLAELTMRSSRFTASQLQSIVAKLETAARELEQPSDEPDTPFGEAWAAKMTSLFDQLDTLLRELDRQVNVGAYA